MSIVIKSGFTLAMVKPPFGLCKTIFGYISNSLKSKLIESKLKESRHICKSKQSRHICKSKTYLQIETEETYLQIKTEETYLQIKDNEEFQATIHRGVIVPVPLFIRGRRSIHLKSMANSKCREIFELVSAKIVCFI